ncbi:MAG: MAPEG family protein [Sulfitobacter sp.]
MIGKRPKILVGMFAGLIWGVCVLWYGSTLPEPQPGFDVLHPMAVAMFPAGLVSILMVGRLAQRRFFDDERIDGDPFKSGSGGDIDQRVLTNTIEQIILALCIWPLAGGLYGTGVIAALGFNFAVARILFWVGYHISPPLRGLGFAATFYPTVLAALLCLWKFFA